MKWLFAILVVLIFLIGVGGAGAYFYPYYAYLEAINEGNGISNEYLNLKLNENTEFNPSTYKFKRVKGTYDQDGSRWSEFHFSNFNFPLPVKHPIYSLIPLIEETNYGLSLGGKYVDYENKEYFSFKIGIVNPFNTQLRSDKLFKVTKFRKYILSKSKKEIWNDVLNKDVRLKFNKNMSLIERVEYALSVPFTELAYNIHLLNLRNSLISKDSLETGILKGKNILVIENKADKHSNFYVENVYVYNNEKIHKLTLKTKKNDLLGASAHDRFLSKLKFKKSSLDAKDMLYSSYTRLPYNFKISELGMVYLLSSWSHDPQKRGFVRQMIQYLEKGKNNLNFLTPLYEYSYKKFNTNFSSIEGRRKENQEERLKRLIIIEAREVKRRKEDEVREVKREITSKEELAEKYLKEAKKKNNSDNEDDELIMD